MIPSVIETHRLVLRPWAFEDIDDLLAYASDEEWGRFLPGPRPYTRSDARKYIAAAALLRDPLQGCAWAIELDRRAVGAVDIDLQFEQRIGTIGYSIGRAVWGRGLTTEAGRAVISACFASVPPLARICATADHRNVASIRVLEKLGMEREGTLRLNSFLRGELADEVCFAVLRQDWEKCQTAV
jgi:ribosomal-protein-alanine N-acetyltransferase